MGMTLRELLEAGGIVGGEDSEVPAEPKRREEAVVPGVHEATTRAYELDNAAEWEKRHSRSPHGQRWHTSFHSSTFPGSDVKMCDRATLYQMMAFPGGGPFSVSSRMIMDAGSDIEARIVERWAKAGILLSSEDSSKQTVLEDPSTWLTCAYDAILDLREFGWTHVLPVDVKSTDHDKIAAIDSGDHEWRPWELKYFRQIQVQIYLLRKHHESFGWPKDLLPAVGGVLYFVSRQRPDYAVEVYVPYDEREVNAGISRLENLQRNFLLDELPERPSRWKWTTLPCKWCEHQEYCKKDVEENVILLTESNGVELSKRVYSDYSPKEIRKAVIERWSDK